MEIKKEIEKSKEYVLGLTNKFLPERFTEEDKDNDKCYRTNLVLSDLVERGIITKNKATRLRKLLPDTLIPTNKNKQK